MSHQKSLYSFVGRLAISAGAAVVALTALGSTAASARYITTIKDWDGENAGTGLQCGGVSAAGQVITIPSDFHNLSKFRFELLNDPKAGLGSMVVRGEVYAWDGTKASGEALWESRPRTLAFTDYAAHKVIFKSGVIPVTPGQQYVVFATVDRDYAECASKTWYDMGSPVGDPYTDGYLVYQSNGGDPTQWTTSNWTHGSPSNLDLAFSVRVSR